MSEADIYKLATLLNYNKDSLNIGHKTVLIDIALK